MKIQDLYPSKYLKGEDLQGRSVTVTIEKLTLEKMGQSQESKPVLSFVGARKSLVLNRTNALVIARLYGDETNLWAGKAVTLFATAIRAFGENHTVVRVSPTKPNSPTKPTKGGDPSQPTENQLDDLEDIADDVDDDVPFTHHADDENAQPDFTPAGDDDAPAAWHSPPAAQVWAIQEGYAANAEDARKLWLEAVKACGGYDRTKAPVVYAKYVEMLRSRQPVGV
jgi:hypothetical protein